MTGRILAALASLTVLSAACAAGPATADDPADPPRSASTESAPAPADGAGVAAERAPTPASGAAVDDQTSPGDGADEVVTAAEPIEPLLAPAGPGDSGDAVERLQERLADLGFGPGSADGDYGRRTEAAVAAFQGLVGLEVTGAADPETVDALAGYRYDGLLLRAGDEGPDVEALQRQLAGGPFDPGPADGDYGRKTTEAVWALEKLAGIPVDGDWGPLDAAAWEQLAAGEIGRPVERHEVRWVEFDLSQQLVKIYDPGSSAPTLISHASSGSGIPWSNEGHSGSSITPAGQFEIGRRIAGWRESSLGIGRLYNPLYFNGGIAFHGSLSVPLYPASHGCVRVPMHIAEYLPDELPNGTPVHVLD